MAREMSCRMCEGIGPRGQVLRWAERRILDTSPSVRREEWEGECIFFCEWLLWQSMELSIPLAIVCNVTHSKTQIIIMLPRITFLLEYNVRRNSASSRVQPWISVEKQMLHHHSGNILDLCRTRKANQLIWKKLCQVLMYVKFNCDFVLVFLGIYFYFQSIYGLNTHFCAIYIWSGISFTLCNRMVL